LGDKRPIAFRGDNPGEHGALRGHLHLSAAKSAQIQRGREPRLYAGFKLRERLRRVLLIAPAATGVALIVEILNLGPAKQAGVGLPELRLERILDFA
jgi:hypothetical protein